MSTTLLLALVVLCTAIVAFFMQEFVHLFKKIFAIPGAKMLLPLLLISSVVEHFSFWIWKILNSIQNLLALSISQLSTVLPGTTTSIIIARALILFSVVFFPWPFAFLMTRGNPIFNYHYWGSVLSAWFWVIFVVLISFVV
jgi:hypothetical protein